MGKSLSLEEKLRVVLRDMKTKKEKEQYVEKMYRHFKSMEKVTVGVEELFTKLRKEIANGY